MDVSVRMATLLYTHSPTFLKDLSQCLADFQDYMSGVGNSIRDAATEVAMGLVHHPDKLSQSLYGSMTGLDSPAPKTVESAPGIETKHVPLRLDAQFQTPVIFFPRAPKSSQVLVAHLGKIAITNSSHPVRMNFESTEFSFEEEQLEEKLFIEIRDMSMYSTDLEKQQKPKAAPQMSAKDQLTTSVFSTPQPGGFVRTSYGTPILHDTVIELSVEKLPTALNQSLEEDELQFPVSQSLEPETKSLKNIATLMQVTGRVVTPLKLTLSKHVYEQILNTLDNIAPPDDLPNTGYSSPRPSVLPDIYELSESLDPSLYSLDTEDSPTNDSEKQPDTSKHQERESPNVSSSPSQDSNLIIRANFEMPVFNILMTGDLGDLQGEQGLVDIKLQDFKVFAEKADPFTKTLEVELKSLLMEDLLQEPSSKHRLLLASFKPEDPRKESQQYLSSSCPTNNIDMPEMSMPSSLPSSLYRENVFEANLPTKPTAKRSNSQRDEW